MASNGSRIRELLASPRFVLISAVLAVVLTLPSVRVGLLFDDYFHQLVLQRPDITARSHRSALDLFRFMSGDVEHNRRLMDAGFVPWWTWPHIRAGFWRPVTAITHWLDYQLWPQVPALMHLQSVAWFGLLVAAVGLLYRRIMGPIWVAGLAALLYAVDDARGMPVGWLANRNAVLAAFFGVAAIIAHHHWRSRNASWAGLLATMLLAVSLLSAEAGIATCAYLFAYAVFLDTSAWHRRALSLLPYALLVVGWRLVWSWQGYGVEGLGLYSDPLTQPLQYAGELIRNAPLLLLGQFALPPPEMAMFLSEEHLRLLWMAAVLVIGGLALLFAPVVRQSPAGRFFACGMLLSLLPISATFPSDRLLFFVSIGAFGLLALFFEAVLCRKTDGRAGGGTENSKAGRKAGRLVVVPAILLAVVHLVIAPLALPIRARFPAGPTEVVQALDVRAELGEGIADKTLVVVNAPSVQHAHYVPIIRTVRGQPVPKHTRALAPGVPSVTLTRLDAHTLLVRPEAGYLTFHFDRLFRTPEHPLAVGDRVELEGMTVQVTALTDDGRPAEAMFRFDMPLEDPSLHWLRYKDGEFVDYTPPALGETVVLEADWPW